MSKKRKTTDHIVVHCAATPPDMDIGSKEIRRWHRAKGWLDIGYHFVIRRNGDIEKGRELDTIGAHARGFNNRSIGICLVGGVDENKQPQDNFTEEQKKNLALLIDQMLTIWPDSKVLGHRDLPGVQKACPSFDVAPWWDSMKGYIENVFRTRPSDQDVVGSHRLNN